MTDYRRLAEAANRIDDTVKRLLAEREEMQSAIEALQAENERMIQEQSAWRSFTEMANNTVSKAESERDALQARLDAMGKGEAVQFLCDATRFKVRQHEGDEAGRIYGLPSELNGRWVALVAADDDCHLKLAAPKALAPLTQQQRMAVWNDVKSEGYGRWEFSFADVVDAVEKAHGIGGTP